MVKYLDFSRRSFINNIVHDTTLQTYLVTHMHKVSILQIVFSQPLRRLVKCFLVFITANTLTTSFISFLLVPYVNLIQSTREEYFFWVTFCNTNRQCSRFFKAISCGVCSVIFRWQNVVGKSSLSLSLY